MNYEVDDNGCWVWSALYRNGYGRMYVDRKPRLAHRVHYEQAKGPIPEGLDLDHLCRVRACVNPDHLEPVTRAENLRRGATTKLTPEAVEEIRASPRTWGTVPKLAKKFGVSVYAVRSVRYGQTWVAE